MSCHVRGHAVIFAWLQKGKRTQSDPHETESESQTTLTNERNSVSSNELTLLLAMALSTLQHGA